MIGQLWCSLADYYIRGGHFEKVVCKCLCVCTYSCVCTSMYVRLYESTCLYTSAETSLCPTNSFKFVCRLSSHLRYVLSTNVYMCVYVVCACVSICSVQYILYGIYKKF